MKTSDLSPTEADLRGEGRVRVMRDEPVVPKPIADPFTGRFELKMQSVTCHACGCKTEGFVAPGAPAESIICSTCSEAREKASRSGKVKNWREWIPKAYRDTDAERLPDIAGYNRAMGWAADLASAREDAPASLRRSLLLYGLPDGGKSRTLYSALNVLDREPLIFRPGRLTAEVMDAYGNGKAKAFLDRLTNAQLLVIEDFGKDKISDRAQEAIFAVIDDRLHDFRPVLITTNYTGIPDKGRVDGVKYFEDCFPDPETAAAVLRRLRQFATCVCMRPRAAHSAS